MAEEYRDASAAVTIKDFLDQNPSVRTAYEIEEWTDLDLDTIRETLDSWAPDPDSRIGVVYVGPGQGGPWIEEDGED